MNTHTKSGLLTDYGFSCGYVQRAKGLRKGDVWMYKEHNTYHVRTSNSWDSYDTLGEGRKQYNSLVKSHS